MGVGVRITNKNLAREGSWRPKWHPVTMTETASLGRASRGVSSKRSRSKRSRGRRRRRVVRGRVGGGGDKWL